MEQIFEDSLCLRKCQGCDYKLSEGLQQKLVPTSLPKKKRPNSPTVAETLPEKKQKELIWINNVGVINSLNIKPCKRSLTCKSHSMALKRSISGRLQPFDNLLSRYQKKSIVRSQDVEQYKTS
ncbi:SCA7, zinc-binding domain-containing protein [Rhizophagus diaphanus]|nr:SCA7, zinc-binding domain-containing protein [Rhizophagus diaphanus] [Rhizophagus sp. MUCL 43196]